MQAGTSGKAAETVNSWCFCSGDNQVLATTHTLTLACTRQNPLSNHKYLQVPTGTNKYPENSKLLQCAQTVNSWCFCWVDHSHRLLNTDTCMNPPVHWWHLYVPTEQVLKSADVTTKKYPQMPISTHENSKLLEGVLLLTSIPTGSDHSKFTQGLSCFTLWVLLHWHPWLFKSSA